MPHKLLLADDSVTIQRVIELTFADEDIRVVSVADGQAAIDRAVQERPDIVLADISMPRRDGYEVAAFIKGEPALRDVPVLLLAGAFEPVDEDRVRATGADGVLVKPFEPQLLIRRVRELLPNGTRVAPEAAGDAAAAGAPATVAPRPAVVQGRPAPPVLAPPTRNAPALPPAPPRAPSAAAPHRGAAQHDVRDGELGTSLDDYFDRLDAAFASLDTRTPDTTTGPGPAAPAEELSDDAWFDRPLHTDALQVDAWRGPADSESEQPSTPAASITPAASDAPANAPEPVAAIEADVAPAATAGSVPPPIAEAAEAIALPTLPSGQTAAAASSAPRVAVAAVFSAMLAEEQGEAVTVPVIAPAALPDALIEDIVQRVVARLSDRVVRDIISDLVSQVAERLVRDEIERLRRSLD